MPTQQFHIGTILSVTTCKMVSLEGVDGVYNLLQFMTQDGVYTHNLEQAFAECKTHLLRQMPWLDSPEIQFEVAKLTEMLKTPSGKAEPTLLLLGWLSTLAATHGERHTVKAIPPEEHTPFDPNEGLSGKKVTVVDIHSEGVFSKN